MKPRVKLIIKNNHLIWEFTDKLPNGYKYFGLYSKKLEGGNKK